MLATADAIGEDLATHIVDRVRATGERFLLGCPTGRTPRPIYDALARRGADILGGIGHAGNIGIDLLRAARSLLHVAGDLAGCGALLVHR